MLMGMPQEVQDSLRQDGSPSPRVWASPPEFVALVRYIVENAYLNGEVIRLDGAILHTPPSKKASHCSRTTCRRCCGATAGRVNYLKTGSTLPARACALGAVRWRR